MGDVRVVGAEQFQTLAKRLKTAGRADLRRELYQGINRAMRPARAAVRASALATLPSRGGLATRVANSKYRVSRRTTGSSVGIKLIATNRYDIGKMDRGRLTHPLFGNRRYWYEQAVRPGWWSQPVRALAPDARREIITAMNNIKEKIEG